MRTILAALALAVSAQAQLQEHWGRVTPQLKSESRAINLREAQILLSSFCATPVRHVDRIGLECEVRSLGAAFSDLDTHFHPETAIYGHFQSAASEDAAVGGWSRESHPALWHGTLLLTKRDGKWAPIRYKSSAVTHSCIKAAIPDRREVLICEERDAGMGGEVHYLYSMDLTKPRDLRDTLLVYAHSFENSCMIRRRAIRGVDWSPDSRLLRAEVHTPRWTVSHGNCAGDRPTEKRPPRVVSSTFELTTNGFRQVK
jgi:hypothetical protein